MKRRSILIGLAAVLARPGFAAAPVRIGWLSHGSAASAAGYRTLFTEGMQALGHVADRDYALEEAYGDGDGARLADASRALADRPLRLIVTYGAAVRIAVEAVKTVPVVFAFSGDPVVAGLAASFARPGGNATGISYLSAHLNAKRLEILKEVLPGLGRVAVLSNPAHPGEPQDMEACRAAAARLGLDLDYRPVGNPAELEKALATLDGAGAVLALSDVLTAQNRQRIAEATTRFGIPLASGWSIFAEAGGLFSYGPDLRSTHRRLAHFADRILKGAHPRDIPIEQPTRFELVVNNRTARTLGIKLPPALLARADEVIE